MRAYKEDNIYYVEVDKGIIERYDNDGNYKGINILSNSLVEKLFKNEKYFNINSIEELKYRR